MQGEDFYQQELDCGNGFSRSQGRLYTVILLIVAMLVGLIAGVFFYRYDKNRFLAAASKEAQTLLSFTSSYLSVYSDIQQSNVANENIVPAEFRARALEVFNETQTGMYQMTALMVGIPGREIATESTDPQLSEQLIDLFQSSEPEQFTQLIDINDSPALPAVFLSFTTKESCVTCHNYLQYPRHHGSWET